MSDCSLQVPLKETIDMLIAASTCKEKNLLAQEFCKSCFELNAEENNEEISNHLNSALEAIFSSQDYIGFLYLLRNYALTKFDVSIIKPYKIIEKLIAIIPSSTNSVFNYLISDDILSICLTNLEHIPPEKLTSFFTQALTWIKINTYYYVGLCFCKKFLDFASASFYPHICQALVSDILPLLLNQDKRIRITAKELITDYLDSYKTKTSINNDFDKIFNFVTTNGGSQDKNKFYASLLATDALIEASSSFVLAHIQFFLTLIDKGISSKSQSHFKILLIIIPKIANINPKLFAKYYFFQAYTFQINLLKKEIMLKYTLNSITQLISSFPSSYKPIISQLLPYITSCISIKKKSKKTSTSYELDNFGEATKQKHEAKNKIIQFAAFKLLIECTKQQLLHENDIERLLPSLFAIPFCYDLVECMNELYSALPNLKKKIKSELIKIVQNILFAPTSKQKDNSSLIDSALKSLVSFSLSEFRDFLDNGVFPHLNNPNPNTRINAVKAAGKLIKDFFNKLFITKAAKPDIGSPSLTFTKMARAKSFSLENLSNYLNKDITKESLTNYSKHADKTKEFSKGVFSYRSAVHSFKCYIDLLLATSISDCDLSVRIAAIEVLTELCDLNVKDFNISNDFRELTNVGKTYLFSEFLYTEETICGLFLLTNDANRTIRTNTLQIINKLGDISSALIYPKVRNLLIFTMNSFKVAQNDKTRLNILEKIHELLTHFDFYLSPFIDSMMKIFCVIYQDGAKIAPGAGKFLKPIFNKMCIINPEVMKAYGQIVLSYLTTALSNSSPGAFTKRRIICFSALRHLLSSTAFYSDNTEAKTEWPRPRLLTFLLEQFMNEIDHAAQKECLLCIGAIGSVTQKVIIKENTSSLNLYLYSFSVAELQYNVPVSSPIFSKLVLIASLIRILNNKINKSFYGSACSCLIEAVLSLENQAPFYAKYYIPSIINALEISDLSQRPQFFKAINSLINFLHSSYKPFLQQTFSLIEKYWDSSLLYIFYNIIRSVFNAFPSDICEYTSSLFQKFIQELSKDNDRTSPNSSFCLRALSLFCLTDFDKFSTLTLNVFILTLTKKTTANIVIDATLDGLQSILQAGSVQQHFLSLLNALLNLLSAPQCSYSSTILLTLSYLAKNCPSQFAFFISKIEDLMKEHSWSCSELELTMRDIKDNKINSFNPSLSDMLNSSTPTKLKSKYRSASPDLYSSIISKTQQNDNSVKEDYKTFLEYWENFCRSTKSDYQFCFSMLCSKVLSLLYPPFCSCKNFVIENQYLAHDLIFMSLIELFNSYFKNFLDQFINDAYKMLMQADTNIEVLNFSLIFNEFIDYYKLKSKLNFYFLNDEMLYQIALKTHSYAKAIFFYERILKANNTKNLTEQNIEELINLYSNADQAEAALGVLTIAENNNIPLKISWLESLHLWVDALNFYMKNIKLDPSLKTNPRICIGILKCFYYLEDWDNVDELCTYIISLLFGNVFNPPPILNESEDSSKEISLPKSVSPLSLNNKNKRRSMIFPEKSFEPKKKVTLLYDLDTFLNKSDSSKNSIIIDTSSTLSESEKSEFLSFTSMCGLQAQWNLGNWENKEYSNYLQQEHIFQKDFFDAIFCIAQKEYDTASLHISKALEYVGSKLITQKSKFYETLYDLQKLVELYEVLKYEKASDSKIGNTIKQSIKQLWVARTNSLTNLSNLQYILSIHALVLNLDEDLDAWLKYIKYCRKTDRSGQALRVIANIAGDLSVLENRVPDNYIKIKFEYLKCLWNQANNNKEKREICKKLSTFIEELHSSSFTEVKGKTYRCLGDFRRELYLSQQSFISPSNTPPALKAAQKESLNEVIKCYEKSITCCPTLSKSWRAWALANSTLIHRNSRCNCANHVHAIESIHALFKALFLTKFIEIQDLLRLLTLFFKYSEDPSVEQVFRSSMQSLKISSWLLVIPQLIARMNSSIVSHRSLVKDVLLQLSNIYPQALVFPISVAAKISQDNFQYFTANFIIDVMRSSNENLIDQAIKVSDGLISVSVLWPEMWRARLEEASRLCYAENNIPAMVNHLQPLYDLLDTGGETYIERNFVKKYGSYLYEAYDLFAEPDATDDEIDEAWNKLSEVYEDIGNKLQNITVLDLNEIAPELLNCENFLLSVPGYYDINKPLITIKGIANNVSVILSKQRPRKIKMYGSNGKTYQYLLKGHEDLRLDERIMQLFGLLNGDSKSKTGLYKMNLAIETFPVIPLSPNSGLIGWIHNAMTFNDLIKQYRDEHKIVLNYEHKLELELSGNFLDMLTLYQRVECFNSISMKTISEEGELSTIINQSSRNAEEWLEKRTTFTKSAAVMSMVGYVLGLGDRHPSNLLISLETGKLTHIDFGDCFEAAMCRDKFPEHVPFRLTRMMINSFGLTGYEGNFRSTCQKVLTLLRSSKDSLMAVLEAFVYEPLINWRLPLTIDNSSQEKLEEMTTLLSKETTHDKLFDQNFNKRALLVLGKIYDKLVGKDFGNSTSKLKKKLNKHIVLNVEHQADMLIKEATNPENLALSYSGWCPFW